MTTQDRGTPNRATPRPAPVVYLVQEPSVPKHNGRVLDFRPLYDWGRVETLMSRTQMASFNPSAAIAQIRDLLRDFDPETDYIAAVGGDTLAVILVGAVLRENGFKFFNYLRFERARLPDGARDPSSGLYVRVRVPLVSDDEARGSAAAPEPNETSTR